MNNESSLEEQRRAKQIEEDRANEMELTDKPLQSVFLFKGMKGMPINCSEKDSVTYKIGSVFCLVNG